MLISSREAFIGWVYPKPTSQIRILFNFSIGTCIISVYQWHLLSTGIIGLGYTEQFSILPTMDRKFITLMGCPESRLCMGFLRFLHILTIRSWTGFSHHLPPNPTSPKPWCFCWGCNFLRQMKFFEARCTSTNCQKCHGEGLGTCGNCGSLIDLVLGDLSW